MNMNYNGIPYEANYSDDIMSMPAMGQGGVMPMGIPMGMGQMQMGNMANMGGHMSNMPHMPSMTHMGNMGAMGMNQMSPYPMQRYGMQQQPMGMMQGMQPQSNQIAMSMSQLPPGAVAPLNSVSVMPVMAGGGAIDSGNMNVVVPDLQPMSHLGSNQSMSQINHARMSGGASGGGDSWTGNSPDMWTYTQGYPSQHQLPQQQQHHHQHHNQQMQQQQQQQHHHQMQHHHQQQQEQNRQHQQRMKAHYDFSKEARNGLNSPSEYDGQKLRNNSAYLGKKVWR